jgi:hypothetical protein
VDFIRSIDGQFEQYDDSGKLSGAVLLTNRNIS